RTKRRLSRIREPRTPLFFKRLLLTSRHPSHREHAAAMPLDVIVVMDPIGSIKVAKDSTFAMLLAAQRRGHRLHYVLPGGLSLTDGVAHGRMASLSVRDDPTNWHELGPESRRAFGPGDVILMRRDPPVDAEYIYDTQI